MPETVPEIMPESLIQHEHEASPSARASVEGIKVRSPEHIASSSAARADVEKALSKSLLECLQAMLQLDPSLVQRNIGVNVALQAAETSLKTIPRSELSNYFHWLEVLWGFSYDLYLVLNLLVEHMIYKHPQLLMEMCPTSQRTFLHAAVIANSEVQVQKVLHMILADDTSSNNRDDLLSRKMKYLFAVERSSGFTAYQMAIIVGNKHIARMIADCEPMSIPALSTQSHVKNETSPPSSNREGSERQVHIEEIGKMLKSCLEALDVSELPLKYMSLGDEFRLHISLTRLDSSTRYCWFDCHKQIDIHKLLRGIVSKLAEIFAFDLP